MQNTKILARLAEIEAHLATMRTYLDMRNKSKDWHGVMDASADIRELEAEAKALRWVLNLS
jgi:hypothetical protein